MRFIALALAALLVSPLAEACPRPNLVDVALTVDGATLLDDGGVVIETRNGDGQAGNELKGGLTLWSGRKQLAATMDFIAPGLVVLRPPRGHRRRIKAVDGNNKVRLTLTQAKAKAPHAAPMVTLFTSTFPPSTSKVPPSPGPGVQASTATLTLATMADDDVIAIVVSVITKDGPVSLAYWRRTEDLTYTYRTGGKGCVPRPGPAHVGDMVAFSFIDKHGRLSDPSKPVAVTAAK